MGRVEHTQRVLSRDIVDALPDAVVVIDSGGTIVHANPTAERLVGRPMAAMVGLSGLDLVHPDDAHLAALSLASVQAKDVGTPIELRLRAVDGWHLMEVVGATMDDDLILLSMRDLTQRRRWEVASDDVATFRSLVQNAASLTMLLDPDGSVRSTSSAITRLLGHDPEDVCEGSVLAIVHPDDQAIVEVALARATVKPIDAEPVTVEARLLQFAGFPVPYELTIVSLLDDPTVGGLVVSGHDITRLRQVQEELEALATVDGLTGLPNRRSFDAELERQWTDTSASGVDSCLLVVDLDGFKGLNDRYGHAAGDDALRQVADALRLSVRETDFVARLGGDEFGVILVRCGGDSSASQFEEMLRLRLKERLGALAAPISFTVGHAMLASSSSTDAVLHDADMAMLGRKQARRDAQDPVDVDYQSVGR